MAVYGLTAEEYWQIYNYQGQRCFICQRATGARKRLSVDHDHETRIVRGLLCTPCNRNVLGHLRDDKYALQRAIESWPCTRPVWPGSTSSCRKT